MKNKSKLQKIRQGARKETVPAEWLYMAPEGLELRKLYEILDEQKACTAEYWEEAEVLEIAVPEAGSLDMECMEPSAVDEHLEEYMGRLGMKTVYAVTILPEAYPQIRKVMEWIAERAGGIFCGDTDDFLPVIKGE